MSAKGLLRFVVFLSVFALVAAACGDDDAITTTTAAVTTTTAAETTTTAAEVSFTFGMILVGPQNDHGRSQAHFEAGQYLEQKTGATMIVLDKVNTADRPETTVDQVIDDMVAQGAQLIFATSDDMKDGVLVGAANHPEVPMIWSSGDNAWAEGKDYRADLTNLGNIMGQMEYGKMIAGCAAALSTQTGQIAYLGPLINDETRRLVNSAFLGARYCYENYREQDPTTLGFEVKWIGFWFNIPGFTLDPTQVTNEFLASGADVVISGIDTTEAIVRVGQAFAADEAVWAIPYDFKGACAAAPAACLGVPYFNWGPSYLNAAQSVIDDEFVADWLWVGPDWD